MLFCLLVYCLEIRTYFLSNVFFIVCEGIMTKKQKLCKEIAQKRNYCKKNAILDFISLMGYDRVLHFDKQKGCTVKTWRDAIARFK